MTLRRIVLICVLAPLLVLVVAAWPAIRLLWLRPNVARNYTAEWNAQLEAIPESDRAWPLYAQVVEALQPAPENPEILDLQVQDAARPSKAALWAKAKAYLAAREQALPLIREAASRPHLGMPYGDAQLHPDPERNETGDTKTSTSDPEVAASNPIVVVIPLPQLGKARAFARHLRLDTARALEQGDGERVLANTEAMFGLSRHASQAPLLIGHLVARVIVQLAAQDIRHALVRHPDLFDESKLQQLRLRFGSVPPPLLTASLSPDRAAFDDTVQRIYSDDGRGDGRLTRDGLRLIASLTSEDEEPSGSLPLMVAAMFVFSDPGRRTTTDAYSTIERSFAEKATRPLWEGWPDELGVFIDALPQRQRSAAQNSPLIRILAPSLRKLAISTCAFRSERDATLVAFAIHQHRLRTGSYPASLDQLPPDLLAAHGTDPFTGRPLLYRPTERGPLLYSAGNDADDDGGRPLDTPADLWRGPSTTDGDWILLAPPAAPAAE